MLVMCTGGEYSMLVMCTGGEYSMLVMCTGGEYSMLVFVLPEGLINTHNKEGTVVI